MRVFIITDHDVQKVEFMWELRSVGPGTPGLGWPRHSRTQWASKGLKPIKLQYEYKVNTVQTGKRRTRSHYKSLVVIRRANP